MPPTTPIDPVLYSTIRLCLLGQRNLLISSPDTVYTEREILKINEIALKFSENEIHHLTCDTKAGPSLWSGLIDRDSSSLKGSESSGPTKTMLIVRNLERTSAKCQVALLDILRSVERRLDTNDFFIVIVIVENIEGSELSLNKYLQDKFWFRQPHVIDYDRADSVFGHHHSVHTTSENYKIISLDEIKSQRSLVFKVNMIPEIKRYLLDILIFVRNHRIVVNGIATKFIDEFELLVRCIAVINGYTYVTPMIVKLASRKFFPLRINICNYEDEPSLNYGSDKRLVKMMMDRWNADLVVEDVLSQVKAPI